MDQEEIGRMIEAALQPIREKLAELEKQIDNLDENTAWHNHHHEDYAYQEHVERSENSFNNRLSRLNDEINTLQYRISDVERKAERAQSTADDANRKAGGGRYW